jgi:hypothetical protein
MIFLIYLLIFLKYDNCFFKTLLLIHIIEKEKYINKKSEF